MRSVMFLVGIAAFCAIGQPAAASGKAGEELLGYTFASNVEAYTAISKDVCDIDKAISAGDYAGAQAIYENGKNVPGKVLRGWANKTDLATEELWGIYTKYYAETTANGTTWLDTYVAENFANTSTLWTSDDSRAQAIKKGVGSGVQGAYMFHELEAAIAKAAAGTVDDAGGAPHAVDEAFGIYAGDGGGLGENGCSLIAIPEKRNTAFQTYADGSCDSAIGAAMTKAFNEAQVAARAGDVDAIKAARDEVKKQFIITYMQATIEYAAKTSKDIAGGLSTDEHAAEGYTFFWTVAPLVAEADAAAAEKVLKAFEAPTADIGTDVATALESTYAGLGITAAEVGTYDSAAPPCAPPPGTAPPAPGSAGTFTVGAVLGMVAMVAAAV